MAQIQRPTTTRRSSSIWNDNIQLFVGMLLGAVLMFWYLGPTTIGNDDRTTSLVLSTKNDNFDRGEDNGWNPIHVYYGERNALPGWDPNDISKRYAQVYQDSVLLDLLGSNGYFLDLAANDAVEFSNTLALEQYGWKGLCIEPNPAYWYGLSHRKCTVVGALVGGGQNKEQVSVKFRGVYGGIVGRLDDKLANRKKEPPAPEVQRYTAPLVDVLERFQVPSRIDYLSLDVEGAEYLIMQHFPFDRYLIRVLTIERPSEELRHLLQQHGYIFLKDLAWWGETLWAHTTTGLSPTHPKIQNIQTEEKH